MARGGERTYRVSAVVLKRINLGETDRLVTLFTRDQGKVGAVVKGARGPKCRLSGATEPFTRFDGLLAAGASLDILTQAQVTSGGGALRKDLARAGYGSHFLELVDVATEDRQAAPEVWSLLVEALDALEEAPHPVGVCRAFELQLMAALGFEAHLDACVVGEHPITAGEEAWFHPERGGAVCPACARRAPGYVRLTAATLPTMRALAGQDFTLSGEPEWPPQLRGELARCLIPYLRHHLEAPLRSWQYLEGLERKR